MTAGLDLEVVAAIAGVAVAATARLGGGDVAESFRVDLTDGTTVFAKTHHDPPPHFFSTEAAGLAWLRDGVAGGPLGVPGVIGSSDTPPLLVLEWIDESRGAAARPDAGDTGDAGATEATLGRSLAGLHRAGAPSFGREDRRTTGSRGLPNDPCDTWSEFYAERRLLPLARIAADTRALAPQVIADLEHVAGRLDELGGPPEPPARLHGDLWAGNRIVDREGRSWLIDPASHGGHREFDLAMMRLFGGFGAACFAAYHEASPLADGWERRVPLHQLAPLVVHAIKFGGGYRAAVEDALAVYR